MQHSSPSRTALRVALRRAAHQLYDSRPLVLDDPFAVTILGSTYREELERTPQRADRPFSLALRAWLVARSRYAEDCLATAVAVGATQYVLLGAGLDTFALRNPHPGLTVFEIDHPATQLWKSDLLSAAGLSLPASARQVPVDFEQDSLREALEANGFQPRAMTLFAWLGVVPYLTLSAFRSTLNVIAGAAPGSAVIMDYSQPRSALPPLERLAHDSLASRVQLAGEPFLLFLTPEQMAAELRAFQHIEDLGAAEVNARYFTARKDLLQVRGSAGRLLSATL